MVAKKFCRKNAQLLQHGINKGKLYPRRVKLYPSEV